MSLYRNSNGLITRAQAYRAETYTSNTWYAWLWNFSGNDFPTFKGGSYFLLDTLSKTSNYQITKTQALYTPVYQNNTWLFPQQWTQQEGKEYPKLVWRHPNADLGEPMTHNMCYFYVVPHVKGTMSYMGLTWKSRGAFFVFPNPPAKGVANQEVTYSIPDADLQQTIVHKDDGEIDLVWFASGVRDVNGAGGFSGYNSERTRSIKMMNNASATVNFYFTQPKWIPRVNYKLSVSTPDGIVDIGTTYKDQSPITFCVVPEIQLGLALTETYSENATNVRVALPGGDIMALASYQKYSEIEMLED